MDDDQCQSMEENDDFKVGEEITQDSTQMKTRNEGLQSSGVTMSFHDIKYEVEFRSGGPCSKLEKKIILKNISGVMKPGLSAIMGPTGSGKTSLLDVLAGRKNPTGITNGYVLMNGKRIKEKYVRLSTGYVVQDDVVMSTLTVRENLQFSAILRLPAKKFNKELREDKVEKLIKDLGLGCCADTKVGDALIRGISGGERKRVSIGMELIIDPPVLFLDEPTTGLDAYTAESIMRLLSDLGKMGTTVITSIHQPRYSIFSMFDQIMILSRGEMMFNGPCNKIVDYFGSIGYQCPQFHNPADYLLDVVNGNIERIGEFATMKTTKEEMLQLEDGDPRDKMENKKLMVLKELSRQYASSDISNEECNKLKEQDVVFSNKSGTTDGINVDYPNGFFHQIGVLSKRAFLDLVRNPVSFGGPFIMQIFVSIIIGLIFFQMGDDINGIQDRAGSIYFLTTVHIMNNMPALELFISKKHLFVHESAGGYYRTLSYFIARVIADIIPYRLIPLVFFTVISYFMMGFQYNAGNFFFFLLNVSLTSICATCLAFAVSSGFNTFSGATAGMMIPLLFFMLFGGFLINTGSIMGWLEWIKWFSIFRYGLNGLLVTEFSGLVFINNSSFPGFDPSSEQPCVSIITNSSIPACTTGEAYLARQDIPYDTWGRWQNPVALTIMCFIYLGLSFLQLLRTSVYK